MTDLEMTKLCAQAMGWHGFPFDGTYQIAIYAHSGEPIPNSEFGNQQFFGQRRYDPLHDDAQAMALVKKFQLCFFAMDEKFTFGTGEPWQCRGPNGSFAVNTDLNRAIVECVAKMQKGKA